MIKCRGENCREEIVRKYTIIPRSHTKLLNGQEKRSCTGDLLTDSYYSFEYINKSNSKDVGGFYCGSHAADHFLNLMKSPRLSVFNPLKSPSMPSGSSKTNGQNSRKSKEWNPVALELYNAINLLIICWNKPIHGSLAKTKEDIAKFCDKEPHDWKTKQVNNIIGKDAKKRSLSSMVNELAKNNPDLKHFTFNHLDEVLNKHKINSNF